MPATPKIRVAVVTMPDQIAQTWVRYLAIEPRVSQLDRALDPRLALELVRRTRPAVVVVARPAGEARRFIQQVCQVLPGVVCVALLAKPGEAEVGRLKQAGARLVLAREMADDELIDRICTSTAVEQGPPPPAGDDGASSPAQPSQHDKEQLTTREAAASHSLFRLRRRTI